MINKIFHAKGGEFGHVPVFIVQSLTQVIFLEDAKLKCRELVSTVYDFR